MTTDTRVRIVEFIRLNSRARVNDLVEYLGLGNVAIHRQLKRLVESGVLTKTGTPPKVFYLPTEKQEKPERKKTGEAEGHRIALGKASLTEDFDKSVFEDISWSYRSFQSHREIAAKLRAKNPYTVTVIIEGLDYKLWNKKEYVKKTKVAVPTKYRQLLFEMFFEEYGEAGGNEIYGKWLDKYRDVWLKEKTHKDLDEYVIIGELEPRYKQKILKRFKNHDELFRDRFRIDRERYYSLPEPFNHVDWRNSFDNIFIWKDDDGKMAAKGGSGSSGGRETNSKFAFGFLEINKKKPVPSYLFLYSGENKLLFIKKFDSLCLPSMDIGSNYHLDWAAQKRIRKGGLFLRWIEREGVESIEIHKE